jgi:hypothetical protein
MLTYTCSDVYMLWTVCTKTQTKPAQRKGNTENIHGSTHNPTDKHKQIKTERDTDTQAKREMSIERDEHRDR